MAQTYTPSVGLALSLATPVPLSWDAGSDPADAPSALPRPTSEERRERRDEYLGPITELIQRFPVGEGVWLRVHWLVNPQTPPRTPPNQVRQVELVMEGRRLPLRRGQMDALMTAMGLAEYVFDTAAREELARQTC